MGYAICFAPCISCRRPFGFNPHRVPSIRLTPDGPREPICRECIERANPERIKNGLEPFTPHPDAYEPIHEDEL